MVWGCPRGRIDGAFPNQLSLSRQGVWGSAGDCPGFGDGAFGLTGFDIDTAVRPEDIRPALERARASGKPSCVDVIFDLTFTAVGR